MRQRGLALAASAGLLLAGCTLPGQDEALPGDLRSAAPEESLPANDPALERFTEQELEWSDCDGGECATLEVPLDHDAPEGETVELAVLRVPARDAEHRIGSLVVNPGGPGSSAVDYARAADQIVSPGVRKAYDVVGFDPRGVGESDPVDCLDDRAMDGFIGGVEDPDSAAGREAVQGQLEAFVAGCRKDLGRGLGEVTTETTARDMDVLRAVLGDSQLSYLGKSYGTTLGATYAELFPQRVGAMVLDGVLPTDLDAVEMGVGQAEGFERATNAFLDWCVEEGDCPVGDSREEAVAGLKELLNRAETEPLPVRGHEGVTELTSGWATYGIAAGMYSETSWPALRKALKAAEGGDGSGLMEMAGQYTDRHPDGHYGSNLMEAFTVYTCNDRLSATEGRDDAEVEAAYREAAPLWGELMMSETSVCDEWPVEPAEPFVAKAAGSGPILVVGTTRDPATPYEWAEQVAGELENGHLLSFDGDGHTAYRRGSSCVDDAVDGYLLSGTVPEGEAADC